MINSSNTLKSIFSEHRGKVSDKWSIYLAEYDRLFEAYRARPIRLLEIGIQNGGSLEIWSKFFGRADKLVGCDINPKCAQLNFDAVNIAVVVADANTDEAEQHILVHSPNFDLIIDDGSHQSGDIVHSFARYFSHLNDGGLYVVEDLHCSYLQDFEGGIFQPYSSIAFFKRLADTINHEHWGIDKTRCELLRSFNHRYNARLDEVILSHIHSIEFINSMCVIRKAEPADNILGSRFVAGATAFVDEHPLRLHGSNSSQTDQSANPWSGGGVPAEAELPIRIREIASLNQDIDVHREEIVYLKQTIAERQNAHLGQLAQFREQIDTHSIELIEREKAFSHHLLHIQHSHEQALNAEIIAKQNELQGLHREIACLSQCIDERDKEIVYLKLSAAETENTHLAQLIQSREQLETHLLELVEREKEFSHQLLHVQATHERQRVEQSHQHADREQALSLELHAKQEELHSLTHRYAEAEKMQALTLAQLAGELKTIRATYSWRWTAPLRSLAALLRLNRPSHSEHS